MKFFILLSTLLLVLCTVANAQVSTTVSVDSDWNLLSLPLSPSNGDRNALFPSALSFAFTYQNGYTAVDTLQKGKGFWLKFSSSEGIPLNGAIIFGDTIQVQAGWNLIGSLSAPIAKNSIQTIPADIVSSFYFGYAQGSGYQATDTLQPGKGYWVKVNQNGYLLLSSVGPCPGTPTVTYKGKTYNTVQIGSQCWFKENLDVGTMIGGTTNQSNNDTIEKYCIDDDSANCETYGGFYQWSEAMEYGESPGEKGICPAGWHIPTYAEFFTLKEAVNNVGNALKAIGEGSGEGAGTNTSGFSILISGYRHSSGNFVGFGSYTNFWSSTKYDSISANYLLIYSNMEAVYFSNGSVEHGYSIRCLKDTGATNTPPNQPSSPTPVDRSSNISTTPTLQWSCNDPDNDSLKYDVYFGTDNPPVIN